MIKKSAVLILLIAGLSGMAGASYISLETLISCASKDKDLEVNVLITNKGDESAYNIQPVIALEDKTWLDSKVPELKVGESYRLTKNFRLSAKGPGSYPLTAEIHYTDANQYPFTALICRTYVHQKENIPLVSGRLGEVSFLDNGRIKLSLKNLSELDLQVAADLVFPRELSCKEKQKVFDLALRSEEQAFFELSNFSALAGSNYQVFTVLQYENKGVHQTTIFPGTVKITGSQGIFGVSRPAVMGFLILLVVIFIVFQFIKKK